MNSTTKAPTKSSTKTSAATPAKSVPDKPAKQPATQAVKTTTAAPAVKTTSKPAAKKATTAAPKATPTLTKSTSASSKTSTDAPVKTAKAVTKKVVTLKKNPSGTGYAAIHSQSTKVVTSGPEPTASDIQKPIIPPIEFKKPADAPPKVATPRSNAGTPRGTKTTTPRGAPPKLTTPNTSSKPITPRGIPADNTVAEPPIVNKHPVPVPVPAPVPVPVPGTNQVWVPKAQLEQSSSSGNVSNSQVVNRGVAEFRKPVLSRVNSFENKVRMFSNSTSKLVDRSPPMAVEIPPKESPRSLSRNNSFDTKKANKSPTADNSNGSGRNSPRRSPQTNGIVEKEEERSSSPKASRMPVRRAPSKNLKSNVALLTEQREKAAQGNLQKRN